MNIYQRTNECIEKGIPIILVSVTDKQGDGPAEVGGKMLVTNSHETFGTVGGGALEYNAIELAKELFSSKKSLSKTYLLNEGKIVDDATTLPMACGGKATLYFEYIGPKEYIYIFGAGHVGQALCNVLKTMNYHVTVIDHRKEVIEQFSGADIKIQKSFEEYVKEDSIPAGSYVVVCTPSHKYDYKVVDALLKQNGNLAYIGMLCSKKKRKEYLDHVYETFGKDLNLTNFYAPVGLALGGGSPAEIAISITSEILAISHQKENQNHMRDIKNSTYNRYWE